MTKILVTQPMAFSAEQKERISKLGAVTFHDEVADTPQEWLDRCKDYGVICSGITGLRDAYSELQDVFISVPFVGVGSFADPMILESKRITLSNSPGANRHAVSEWIIYMLLTIMRKMGPYINTVETPKTLWPVPTTGLAGRNITILGKGNIGKRVGVICEAFEMNVTYFARGDNLANAVKHADVVVDVLSTNPTTKGLLGKDFFAACKNGAVFISVTVDAIVDVDAMLIALDSGKLSAVAHDVMNAKPGDTSNPLYLKLQSHPRTYVTPHISGFSDITNEIGNNTMIDNVEAWLHSQPKNVWRG